MNFERLASWWKPLSWIHWTRGPVLRTGARPYPLSPLSFKKVKLPALDQTLRGETRSFCLQQRSSAPLLSLPRSQRLAQGCRLWRLQALQEAMVTGVGSGNPAAHSGERTQAMGALVWTVASVFLKPFQGQKTIWSAQGSCESTLWSEELYTCKRLLSF